MPVSMISLPDALDALDIPFEFLDAVDGHIPPEYGGMLDRTALVEGCPLLETEFGCAVSHINAYRMIERRGIP